MIKQALLKKKRPENRIFIDRNRRAFLKSTLEQATSGSAAFFWRNWSHARHSHIVLFRVRATTTPSYNIAHTSGPHHLAYDLLYFVLIFIFMRMLWCSRGWRLRCSLRWGALLGSGALGRGGALAGAVGDGLGFSLGLGWGRSLGSALAWGLGAALGFAWAGNLALPCVRAMLHFFHSAQIFKNTTFIARLLRALYRAILSRFAIFQTRKMFQNHAFSSVLRFSKTPCFSKTFPVAHSTQFSPQRATLTVQW